MHIIVRKEGAKEKVINILFTEDNTEIRKYIMGYMTEIINSLLMAPIGNGIRKLEYSIEEKEDKYILVKTYKKTMEGYVYNTSTKIKENLMEIRNIEHDGETEYNEKSYDILYTDINIELNKKVLKQLDQESLYQVITKIQDSIILKNVWTNKEYTNMTSEIIKNFKKELYSSVAKKLKRYGNYGIP